MNNLKNKTTTTTKEIRESSDRCTEEKQSGKWHMHIIYDIEWSIED